MRCKTALKLLSPYMDRQLNRRSRTALSKHIAVCPDCLHELDSLNAIKTKMDSLQVPQVPPFLADRIVACAGDVRSRLEIGWVLESWYARFSKWMAPVALVFGLMMGTVMGISNTPGYFTAQAGEMDLDGNYTCSLCCWSPMDQHSIEQVTLALMEN